MAAFEVQKSFSATEEEGTNHHFVTLGKKSLLVL